LIDRSKTTPGRRSGRPKQFNVDVAVQRALSVFQAKGFAGATTKELHEAMGIGQQSLYDTFGDKRGLYLLALKRYHRARVEANIARLKSARTPLDGIAAMLSGVVADSQAAPEIGFLAVRSIAEFGCADTQVAGCRAESDALLHVHIVDRIKDAQRSGDVWGNVDRESAASFVEVTMYGLEIAARAGMSRERREGMVEHAIKALKR
jgi:TetR/AcrR family transcriptional regulator, transcriptional repressor for nem operon